MSKIYLIEIYRGVVIVDLNFKKIYYLINFGKKKCYFYLKFILILIRYCVLLLCIFLF